MGDLKKIFSASLRISDSWDNIWYKSYKSNFVYSYYLINKLFRFLFLQGYSFSLKYFNTKGFSKTKVNWVELITAIKKKTRGYYISLLNVFFFKHYFYFAVNLYLPSRLVEHTKKRQLFKNKIFLKNLLKHSEF
jgi:hypothetical protein